MSKIDNFERAFRVPVSSCRGECHCGKVFYTSCGGWDFEEGEIERLEEIGATDVEYAIGYVRLEGKEYVDSCDCRNERVDTILNFIDSHAYQIADYLNITSRQLSDKAKSISVTEKMIEE